MRFDNTDAKDVLMEQLPTWFKPVLEYIELMQSFGVQLNTLNEQGQQIYNNQFIQTADLATIQMWERLFGITVRYGDTLEFRRARLIQKFSQIVPYTYWDLKDRLTALYGEDGYTLEVDPEECWIKIFVTSDRYGAIDLLYDLIWDIVPAHLKIYANQEVQNYLISNANVGAVISNTFVQNIGTGGN
jgi:hypothetical protein